jgi:hypothetical protein
MGGSGEPSWTSLNERRSAHRRSQSPRR